MDQSKFIMKCTVLALVLATSLCSTVPAADHKLQVKHTQSKSFKDKDGGDVTVTAEYGPNHFKSNRERKLEEKSDGSVYKEQSQSSVYVYSAKDQPSEHERLYNEALKL